MSGSLPRWKLYSLMAGLVVIGAGGASFARLQGKQTVNGDKWEHPWFQAFAMFVGESIGLIYYYFLRRMEIKKYGTRGLNPEIIEARKLGLKTKINPLLFIIPTSGDGVASAMIYFAYLNMPISVAEMMGGALILITTISTVIFLGKRYYLYQWGSLVLIIGGVVMVGTSSITNNSDGSENPTVGIILMLGAMGIQAAQMIVEEKLFRNYRLSPFKVIGMEGAFGVAIYIVFLFVAYFIQGSSSICHDGRLENTLKAFGDLFKNFVLLFLFIGLILIIGIYNTLGVSVTKYASGSNRATVNTSKVVIIWLFFLLYPGDGGETFHWLQFSGFILIVIGTFIFNARESKSDIEEHSSIVQREQSITKLNESPEIF